MTDLPGARMTATSYLFPAALAAMLSLSAQAAEAPSDPVRPWLSVNGFGTVGLI